MRQRVPRRAPVLDREDEHARVARQVRVELERDLELIRRERIRRRARHGRLLDVDVIADRRRLRRALHRGRRRRRLRRRHRLLRAGGGGVDDAREGQAVGVRRPRGAGAGWKEDILSFARDEKNILEQRAPRQIRAGRGGAHVVGLLLEAAVHLAVSLRLGVVLRRLRVLPRLRLRLAPLARGTRPHLARASRSVSTDDASASP